MSKVYDQEATYVSNTYKRDWDIQRINETIIKGNDICSSGLSLRTHQIL